MPRKTQNDLSRLTVEQILNGTALGSTQSVGHMEVIPILDGGEASDDTFAPPNFSAGTHGYGQVSLRNLSADLPTIAPTGAGWITSQAAQDHATLTAKFLKAGENKTIDQAVCIQQTQGGLIKQGEDTMMVILPAALRAQALAARGGGELGRLWTPIANFNRSMGISSAGNLVEFLKHYQKELDEFVAEFEIVPNQIGAIVLINGQVVGVERAPNMAFWQKLWTPLIRVCYGSLALKARKVLGNKPSPTRTRLNVQEKSLAGIAAALKEARVESSRLVTAAVDNIKATPLLYTGNVEDKMLDAELLTVANTLLAGQIVLRGLKTPYISLCASGA